jgi:hypothetical protein
MIKYIMGIGGIGLALAVIIGIAVFMPLLYIWALNTIFGLAIAYSFETWCAMVLLQMFFHTSITLNKDKK